MYNRLSKLVIALLFYIGQKTVALISKLIGISIPPSLIILTYHSVKKADTASFKKQMTMLLNYSRPISLNNDISALPGGINVAVTFDDAYQSVVQNALNILQLNKIPATIFVPVGCLGKNPPWIKNPKHQYAQETILTESQLKELPADLISIGSHGVLHIELKDIDEETANNEIFESKRLIEELLNTEIHFYSAPFAEFDDNFTHFFKEAGYNRVFLNFPTYPASRTDLYVLGRTSVEPTDWPIEFRLKLAGAYQWLPLAIGLKKKLLGLKSINQQH